MYKHISLKCFFLVQKQYLTVIEMGTNTISAWMFFFVFHLNYFHNNVSRICIKYCAKKMIMHKLRNKQHRHENINEGK